MTTKKDMRKKILDACLIDTEWCASNIIDEGDAWKNGVIEAINNINGQDLIEKYNQSVIINEIDDKKYSDEVTA